MDAHQMHLDQPVKRLFNPDYPRRVLYAPLAMAARPGRLGIRDLLTLVLWQRELFAREVSRGNFTRNKAGVISDRVTS